MKITKICLALTGLLALSTTLSANTYENKYLKERGYYSGDRNRAYNHYYRENINPAFEGQEVDPHDPKIKVLSWDSTIPLSRLLTHLREGKTDQNMVLRLFSGPNIITRSLQDKEVWVYHWLWSYQNPEDANWTKIEMSKPGKRVRRNSRPVSLVLTFNKQDVLESYSVKFLKVKRDMFE